MRRQTSLQRSVQREDAETKAGCCVGADYQTRRTMLSRRGKWRLFQPGQHGPASLIVRTYATPCFCFCVLSLYGALERSLTSHITTLPLLRKLVLPVDIFVTSRCPFLAS